MFGQLDQSLKYNIICVFLQWDGFNVNNRWLVETELGLKLLIVEADSTMTEQAYAMQHQPMIDLSLQDASQVIIRLYWHIQHQ